MHALCLTNIAIPSQDIADSSVLYREQMESSSKLGYVTSSVSMCRPRSYL